MEEGDASELSYHIANSEFSAFLYLRLFILTKKNNYVFTKIANFASTLDFQAEGQGLKSVTVPRPETKPQDFEHQEKAIITKLVLSKKIATSACNFIVKKLNLQMTTERECTSSI